MILGYTMIMGIAMVIHQWKILRKSSRRLRLPWMSEKDVG
jgi:hypothetical protein